MARALGYIMETQERIAQQIEPAAPDDLRLPAARETGVPPASPWVPPRFHPDSRREEARRGGGRAAVRVRSRFHPARRLRPVVAERFDDERLEAGAVVGRSGQ